MYAIMIILVVYIANKINVTTINRFNIMSKNHNFNSFHDLNVF